MTRAELEQDCDFLGLIIMQVINFRQALELPIREVLKMLQIFIMHALKVFNLSSPRFSENHIFLVWREGHNEN